MVERLEWRTDVQTSSDGTEHRRGLRAFPRHTYSFDIYAPTALAKASLAALRTESRFLVPLWPHVIERPETGPDAGIAAADPRVLLLDERGGFLETVAPLVWTPEYGVAAPCAVARHQGTQRGFTHQTWQVSLGSVSFVLEGFQEVVPPYDGATSPHLPSLPLLDAFTQAGDGLSEQIDVQEDTFDAGWLPLQETRYTKRTYTLRIVLNTREKVLAFRRLLFALKGRLNPLRWTAPGDDTEKTWRLASDAVDLSYQRPALAMCTLSLTELNE